MLSLNNLTWDIRNKALGFLMFLKRKQSGKMKVRGCANGCLQREYIAKEESSSPTVSLYVLMGSCLMDVMDKKKEITINIAGAFLQGDWQQDEHPGYIMFKGIMVDAICEFNPLYYDNTIRINDCKKKLLFV